MSGHNEVARRTVTPLTETEANQQALLLRTHGISYHGITAVMNVYHGYPLHPSNWRTRLRRLGAPPKPHGAPYQPKTPPHDHEATA